MDHAAKFVGPNTLEVDGKEYTASTILVATGGEPIIPEDIKVR